MFGVIDFDEEKLYKYKNMIYVIAYKILLALLKWGKMGFGEGRPMWKLFRKWFYLPMLQMII